MTFFEDKVVPFERPASYWLKKARKAYKPDRLPEAARLMRKALEQGGDSHTALELAAIYRSMLCIGAAERYLMKAAAEGGHYSPAVLRNRPVRPGTAGGSHGRGCAGCLHPAGARQCPGP